MAITSDTALTHVKVVLKPGVPNGAEVSAYNGSARVGGTLHGRDLPGPSWNRRGNASFQELDRRIEEGELDIHYWIGSHMFEEDFDDLPEWAQIWIKTHDPFRIVTSSTAGTAGPTGTTGPHTEFWYKRQTGTETPTVPSLDTFDNNVNTIETLMDGSGWQSTIPSGTGSLYHTRITWSVTNNVASAQASAPDTQDIRWSTDGGDTFTTTEPSNYDDVDSIQHYVAGYGWITYVVREEIIDPYRRLGGANWQNGNDGSVTYDQYVALPTDTALIQDNYKVGFIVRKRQSWSATEVVMYGGECEFNTRELLLTYPSALPSQDSNGQVGNTTYMMVMNKETGGFDHVGICDPATRCADYDSTYYATWKFVWLAYPRTRLNGSISASDTSVTVDSSFNIAANDIVFVADEQMRVSANASNVLTVVRGVNGTTAAAHGDNTTLRARVNRDEVEYVGFLHRNGVSTITTIQIYTVTKRGIE